VQSLDSGGWWCDGRPVDRMYPLPPESPLDPPDDEASANAVARYQHGLIEQAEEDLREEKR